MLRFVFALSLIFVLTPLTSAFAAETGKITGGAAHRAPDWFKDSFLDLKEDASEAAAEGKHAMIFFDLAGCPYCARMMAESVGPQRALIEPFFDSIALDIKGSREVSIDGENQIEERALAKKFRVRFTPTVVFLDENAKTVFRINGFWNPDQFRTALNYVKTKSYKKMKIAAFAKQQKSQAVYSLRQHKQLKQVSDFSGVKTPLLVLFEDENCSACPELHDTVLNRPAILKELKAFTFVRLNPNSTTAITDVDGNSTTPAQWAQKLAVKTSPTFIAFNEGKEIQRVGAALYSYHFSNLLSYVSGKHYKTIDNWIVYSGQRSREILQSGKDIDLSRDGPGSKAGAAEPKS